jgi:RecA/RadA recombinase
VGATPKLSDKVRRWDGPRRFKANQSTMDEIERLLTRTPQVLTKGVYVSSGSTLLNLALTGTTSKGFLSGHYYRFVGDSSSGKTFLMLTCLAEASINKAFDNYDFYFDDAENGAGFDFARFFGSRMEKRVRPPKGSKTSPLYSLTVEDFYDNLNDTLDKGPCIYMLDSMDALDTRADQRKYHKQKSARQKGKEDESGSFGMDKMKQNSYLLRKIIPKLRKTGSIVGVVSQTRDKISTSPMPVYGGDTKTAGGGHSLKFYTRCELWLSIKSHIYTQSEVRGRKRELGIVSNVRVKKNRQTGKDWSVEVPIYHQFGIDDVGGCVDFLVGTDEWKKSGTINAKDFGVRLHREKLIQYVGETSDREKKLRLIVKRVWKDIEEKCRIQRRPRYE